MACFSIVGMADGFVRYWVVCHIRRLSLFICA